MIEKLRDRLHTYIDQMNEDQLRLALGFVEKILGFLS